MSTLKRAVRNRLGLWTGKHGPLTFSAGDRLTLGSVRNPWDWYVSQWAFGCKGRGALHQHLAASPGKVIARKLAQRFLGSEYYPGERLQRSIDWSSLYGDPNDVNLFRRWLHHILNDAGRKDLPEGFSTSQLREFAGLMTYRLCRIYIQFEQWPKCHASVSSHAELSDFYDRHQVLDAVIRMENMSEGLADVLQCVGTQVTIEALEAEVRTNASSHCPWKEYYDEALLALVKERDALIFDRFDY